MGTDSHEASTDRAVYNESVQRRGRAMMELVAQQLPQEFSVPSIRDGWPAVGVEQPGQEQAGRPASPETASSFSEYVHNGAVFEQYEVNRYHVLATDLISPIDHRYQITRRAKSGRRISLPMQAVDHLIVGMGIVLARIAGRENVLMLTSDQRMCAVIDKACDKVSSPVARELGLPDRARALGYKWTLDLFPRVVNLKTATKVELAAAFGQWPLVKTTTRSGARAAALPSWAIIS